MSIVIPDNAILSRRINYSCCVADLAHQFIVADRYGEACAEELLYKMEWMQNALGVMNRTPTSTEEGCVTHAYACKIMQWADPMCGHCECCPPFYQQDPCATLPFMQVASAEDAGQQNALVGNTGMQYLIVSNSPPAGNEWASHVGDIATTNGTTWSYVTPPAGSLILSINGSSYWITYSGGAGTQYPVVDGQLAGASILLSSVFPQVNAIAARNVVVQVSNNSTDWVTVFVGSESALSTVLIVDAIVLDATYIRSYYYVNECQYGPSNGTVQPDACAVARTIAYGADASEQGTLPNTLGIEYLIISDETGAGNAWASQVGDIATGDGVGGWTYTTPADLSTSRTTTDFFGGSNVIWITSGGGTITPYFPPLLANVLWNTATITTDWTPSGHDIITRPVTIEQSNDGGTTWTTAFSGPESDLGDSLDITIIPGVDPLMRVLYGGLCPGQSTVMVSVVPARSLRISSGAQMSYGSVGLIVPMRQQTFTFGTYMKAAGALDVNAFYFDYTVSRSNGYVSVPPAPAPPASPPALPENYQPIIISLIKDSTDPRWLGNHNIILSCSCRSNVQPLDYDVYSRAYEIPGLRALLEDGNWHSIDIVRSTVTVNSFDFADWKVYVDGSPVVLNEIYTVGSVDLLVGYTNVAGNFAPKLTADGLTGGRDLLWKNTYWCTGALTQSQITNVARTGSWSGAIVGLQAMFGYDLPATCSWPPTLPYMGERYNPAIPNDPAGGGLIPGGMTLVRSGPTGNGEFVNDVPSTLLFP